MPYAFKKSYKAKTYKKKQPVGPKAGRLARVPSGVEIKRFLWNNVSLPLDWSGDIEDLSPIAQVPSSLGRIGINIKPVSLLIMGHGSFYGVPVDAFNQLRLIVFQWYGNTIPTVGDILANAGSRLACDSSLSSQAIGRMKILLDWRDCVDSVGKYVTQPFSVLIPGSMMRRIYFDGASLTGQNKIFALRISDSSAAPNPTLQWTSTLSYTDS